MRIPLLVKSSPSVEQSAMVRIPAGTWTIELDSKETLLNLTVGGMIHPDIKSGDTLTVDSPTPVRAFIEHKGTDKNISLYLNDNLTEHA